MPAVQAKQISNTLNSLKLSGEIRDAKEYSNKLKRLSGLINAREPIPSFSVIPVSTLSYCSSSLHNLAFTNAKNDVEAAFLQLDEMTKSIKSHHYLIMNSITKDLLDAISEQEATIRKLEWLSDQDNGFTNGLANTFSVSNNLIADRTDPMYRKFYFDNRTYKEVDEQVCPTAEIDNRANKAFLKNTTNPVKPISVSLLTDSNSYGTVLSVDANQDIKNIIDGSDGTFWTRNVYLNSPTINGVNTVLEFDFGSAIDIDYLIIDGAGKSPFYLYSAYGIDNSGSKFSLSIPETKIEGKTRIDFISANVNKVILTFKDKTYDEVQYVVPKEMGIFDLLYSREDKNTSKLLSIGPIVDDAITSKKISKICNVATSDKTIINAYLYSISIDNVWAGNSKYVSNSVLVSKPLKIEDVGLIGISAKENIADTYVKNSIEYFIIKVDEPPYDKITMFPIPRYKQKSVEHERLVLTTKYNSKDIPDVGKLRFYPVNGSLSIYENGKLLLPGSGGGAMLAHRIDSTGSLVWEARLEDEESNLNPASVYIKINNPKSNSVYTVSYTIKTSGDTQNSSIIYLDPEKKISLLKDSSVKVQEEENRITSNLYLQITLRKNLPDLSFSPELHEYIILASSYLKG
jgi:hypothetical protein